MENRFHKKQHFSQHYLKRHNFRNYRKPFYRNVKCEEVEFIDNQRTLKDSEFERYPKYSTRKDSPYIKSRNKSNSIYDSKKIITNISNSNEIPNEALENNSQKYDKELPEFFDGISRSNQPQKNLFYKDISMQIENIKTKITKNNSLLYPVRNKVYNEVIEIIQKTIISNRMILNWTTILYGSQATGLATEESDIDILISFSYVYDCQGELLYALYNSFILSKKFKEVKQIPHASVPVIKLDFQIDENDLKQMIFNSNDNKSKIESIKVDISFHKFPYQYNCCPNISSISTINYIKNSIAYLPNLGSIILVLKKILKIKNLNNYYKGGLSSLSLILLLFSFYKYKYNTVNKDNKEIKDIKENEFFKEYTGHFLMQFLDFYSKFSFEFYGVDIKKDIPFYLKPEDEKCYNVIIKDPFSSNNIAAGTFNIEKVQDMFKEFKNNLLKHYKINLKIYNDLYNKSVNNYNNSNNNMYSNDTDLEDEDYSNTYAYDYPTNYDDSFYNNNYYNNEINDINSNEFSDNAYKNNDNETNSNFNISEINIKTSYFLEKIMNSNTNES